MHEDWKILYVYQALLGEIRVLKELSGHMVISGPDVVLDPDLPIISSQGGIVRIETDG